MDILKIYPGNPDARAVQRVADSLKNGALVIYPTDTLYAIGCDAMNRRAVDRLCALKGLNPAKNLLSIVCPDISSAAEYVQIDNNSFSVLKQYVPGAYTFVLPALTRLPKALRGRRTIGVRVPDNNIAIELARALGNPILTSSVFAPDSGDNDVFDITNPEALAQQYAATVDIVIDGGEGSADLSTVVDLCQETPQVVRPGAGIFE